ncbi:helix-turn-helix transcriptional regulator [Eikenella corrodens]|uniref:helix-turn-helix domain-containing protein n=1 Tax=Eikenella corrodens TaxID=539 RepID=UPI0028EF2B66|nr:helix-turn-helix transcriptional regulator [Eikenella corrodens]
MKSKTTHTTPAGGNVFADLGFQPEEAAKLKAHSDMVIQTKLKLAKSVSDWITEQDLKQEQAAAIFNTSRPRVSDLVNGKIGKFTIDALLSMLAATGQTAELNIRR